MEDNSKDIKCKKLQEKFVESLDSYQKSSMNYVLPPGKNLNVLKIKGKIVADNLIEFVDHCGIIKMESKYPYNIYFKDI